MSDATLATDQAHRFVAFSIVTQDYLGHGATDVDAARASLQHTGGNLEFIEVVDCADRGVHIARIKLPLYQTKRQPNCRTVFRGDGFAPNIPAIRLTEMTQALGLDPNKGLNRLADLIRAQGGTVDVTYDALGQVTEVQVTDCVERGDFPPARGVAAGLGLMHDWLANRGRFA